MMIFGDASTSGISWVWRLLGKLRSCGGCCSLFVDFHDEHSFISLRFLGGGVVGWWCLSGVLWCSLFSSLDIGLTLLLRVLEEPLCLLTV
jgi:hypothetical protein